MKLCPRVCPCARAHSCDQSDTTSVFERSLYRNSHEDWSLWNAGDFLMTIEWIELIKSTINLRVLARTHSLTWGHKVEIIQKMMTRFISQFCRLSWVCVDEIVESHKLSPSFLIAFAWSDIIISFKEREKTLTHSLASINTHVKALSLTFCRNSNDVNAHTLRERGWKNLRIID